MPIIFLKSLILGLVVIKKLTKIVFIIFLSLFVAQSVCAKNYFIIEKSPLPPQEESAKTDGLPQDVLAFAMNAYTYALKRNEVHNPFFLTVIDFDMPSYKKRLWVIDLHNDHVIMNIHVAQGSNSVKIYATRFSNRIGSHESSLGVFTTVGAEYHGKFGESLHLKGLELGINDNAYYRGIIIHSEQDVSPDFIRTMGYAGQTWGCFAVNPDHIDRLIELLQGGSVVYVYASPEKNDLNVNHDMSSGIEEVYNAIVRINANTIARFFHAF